LSEPLGTVCNCGPKRSQAQPVDPALFLSGRKIDANINSAAARPDGTPVPISRSCFNAPTTNLSHFGPFLAPGTSQNSGQKSPSPAASTGGRSGQSGTLQETTGGTQTHSRRTGSKLRQLPCARQGLVRDPESNTKYGGKAGKTGVALVPSMLPSISESSGIPKRKKLFGAREFELRPTVHRATIYCG
jgi:hypothetical protein